MPRGGARINSGPPPDPEALRRDRTSDKDGWTLLPAAGYDGQIPRWPLSRNMLAAEKSPDFEALLAGQEEIHWAAAWRTPQAAAWANLGWTHDVALYIRHLALAEQGDMKAAGEVRQWSDRLGLNPAAMLRNRWKMAPDQVGAKRASIPAAPRASSARERLAAIPGN